MIGYVETGSSTEGAVDYDMVRTQFVADIYTDLVL